MVDKEKNAPPLVVHRLWVPYAASEHRRPIAYASERRRRIGGSVLIALGVLAGLAVVVARGAFWLAFIALLIAWAGAAYGGGGRTGFYQVDEDGGLGEYLGRSRPDVALMRPHKPG